MIILPSAGEGGWSIPWEGPLHLLACRRFSLALTVVSDPRLNVTALRAAKEPINRALNAILDQKPTARPREPPTHRGSARTNLYSDLKEVKAYTGRKKGWPGDVPPFLRRGKTKRLGWAATTYPSAEAVRRAAGNLLGQSV